MKDSNMAVPALVPGWAHSVSPTVLSTLSEASVFSQSTGCTDKVREDRAFGKKKKYSFASSRIARKGASIPEPKHQNKLQLHYQRAAGEQFQTFCKSKVNCLHSLMDNLWASERRREEWKGKRLRDSHHTYAFTLRE